MTDQDWLKVENSMNCSYGRITLICDDFRLTLDTGIYKRKISTTVYVNGHWKGEWHIKDCEERRRFFRPVKCLKWKPRMIKGLSKKNLKLLDIDPKETIIYYDSMWGSFKPLKAHLIKNNTSIELAGGLI